MVHFFYHTYPRVALITDAGCKLNLLTDLYCACADSAGPRQHCFHPAGWPSPSIACGHSCHSSGPNLGLWFPPVPGCCIRLLWQRAFPAYPQLGQQEHPCQHSGCHFWQAVCHHDQCPGRWNHQVCSCTHACTVHVCTFSRSS